MQPKHQAWGGQTASEQFMFLSNEYFTSITRSGSGSEHRTGSGQVMDLFNSSIFSLRTRKTAQETWWYSGWNVKCLTKGPNIDSYTAKALYVRAFWNAIYLMCCTIPEFDILSENAEACKHPMLKFRHKEGSRANVTNCSELLDSVALKLKILWCWRSPVVNNWIERSEEKKL